jgi:thiamine biosynthesis protein ThiI
MLSEDIDTAVASWLMMKRGSHVIPLFIETTGGHEQKMVDMARKLREFAPVNEYRLVIAPFLETAKSISSVKEEQCKWLLHKRMMYRVACSVAKKLCALGIITGERLDIDSRTLLNLSTIDEVAGFAVYRPLIGLGEMEVQTLARRIGLCQVRAQGEENASISRDEPVLIELDRIRAIEKDLHVDLLVQNALQKTRKIDL